MIKRGRRLNDWTVFCVMRFQFAESQQENLKISQTQDRDVSDNRYESEEEQLHKHEALKHAASDLLSDAGQNYAIEQSVAAFHGMVACHDR
jgi:hypothetical protein